MPMTLLVALIVVLALLAVLVFYELFWKERLKRRWARITLSVILSAILSPAIFHIIVSWNNQQREQAEFQFREAVIKGLYDQKVEYAQLEQLLILKYKEIYGKGEKEAKDWAKDFLSSIKDRRAEKNKLVSGTQELVRTLELRWNPLYKYLLKSFDERTAELIQHSTTKIVASKDSPIVISDQVHQRQETLREIVFPNGNKLFIILHSAVVDRGQITWYPNVIFREEIKGEHLTVFVVTFRDEYYALKAGHPRHYGFLEGIKVNDDPLENEKFLSLVNKAINRAFESGFL